MPTLLDNAVNQISRLPGIGRKTALRLVLHMLRQDQEDVTALADALTILRRDVKYCKICYNISDTRYAITFQIRMFVLYALINVVMLLLYV